MFVERMRQWVRRDRQWNWRHRVALLLTSAVMWMVAGSAAFAAGPAPVSYGTPNGAAGTVITALEGIAGTIRDVLGATALVAFLVAAIVNHMVHDDRAKDRAKEIMASAVVGLLVAAFAPAIVNWIASL